MHNICPNHSNCTQVRYKSILSPVRWACSNLAAVSRPGASQQILKDRNRCETLTLTVIEVHVLIKTIFQTGYSHARHFCFVLHCLLGSHFSHSPMITLALFPLLNKTRQECQVTAGRGWFTHTTATAINQDMCDNLPSKAVKKIHQDYLLQFECSSACSTYLCTANRVRIKCRFHANVSLGIWS